MGDTDRIHKLSQPGVDVCEEGRLLAGYTYRNHQECSEGLSEVLATYLR